MKKRSQAVAEADATRSEPRAWMQSTAPSLGTGWEGQAWVHLQRIAAGLATPDEALVEALARRGEQLQRRPLEDACGAMYGSASSALVYAMAAEFDRTLRPLAKQVLARFVASCAQSKKYDFMSGRAGALLACAELEGFRPGLAPASLARKLHASCIKRTRVLLDVAHDGPIFIGLTHGLAGFVLALENGRAGFGFDVPKGLVEEAYAQIREASVEGDTGSIFCRNTNQEPYVGMHAFCHGAPGIGVGLLACDLLQGTSTYAPFVRGILKGTFEFKDEKLSFCCGMTGRSHILLEAFRLTGAKKRSLLTQAKDLRDLTVRKASRAKEPFAFEASGFLKSKLALHYLDERLRHPKQLPMPGLGLHTGRAARGLG